MQTLGVFHGKMEGALYVDIMAITGFSAFFNKHDNKKKNFVKKKLSADHDYCRFQFVLFVDQTIVIGNKMCG